MAETRTILVVDDDRDLQEVIVDLLTGEGYEVAAVGDMAGAVMRLENDPPDLVILDIGLPDGDGYELCRRITEDSRTSSIPVVVLTGLAGLNSRMRGFINGARKYITKPFDLDDLVEVVATLARAEN